MANKKNPNVTRGAHGKAPARKNKKWIKDAYTDEENRALYAGVMKHGAGNWKRILRDPEYGVPLAGRSNVSIKDRWRNYLGYRKNDASTSNLESVQHEEEGGGTAEASTPPLAASNDDPLPDINLGDVQLDDSNVNTHLDDINFGDVQLDDTNIETSLQAAPQKERVRKRVHDAPAAPPATSLEAGVLSNSHEEVLQRDLQPNAVSVLKLTEIGLVNEILKDKTVLIRGLIQRTNAVSNTMGILIVKDKSSSIQCILNVGHKLISRKMVKFATSLSKESHVDIEGIVSVPENPIQGTTQLVRLKVTDCRDITVMLKGISRIHCHVESVIRKYLASKGFVASHTSKLIPSSTEAGASVFTLDHKGLPTCLYQSPLHQRQLQISDDFQRIFEVGSVFKDSFPPGKLSEFIGLDVEMNITENYYEVMEVVDGLFVAIFDSLTKNCKKELKAIGKQYPFKPLEYLEKTLELTFEQGVQMLEEAGTTVNALGELNIELERKLGMLVLEKYGTEFYILHRYPSAWRPFYTMPADDDTGYSNSFDVFIRGNRIVSGAQRLHTPELLRTRADNFGVDLKSVGEYIDTFRSDGPKHGGFSLDLKQVGLLFCALNNLH